MAKIFRLWFPWTADTVGLAEADLPATHDRPLAEVLARITRDDKWTCEQAYLTDKPEAYRAQGTVMNRFYPVSLRGRVSSRMYARQWSVSALRDVLLHPPDALAVFSAYGLFAKAIAYAAHVRRVPYIVIVGGWYDRISRSQKWYFDHAYRVLVHTEMQKRALTGAGYGAENIEIFPLGIDTAQFTPKPDGAYAPHADYPRLLYVGRLQASKGPYEALLTFEAVKCEFPHATLTLAGPCTDTGFMARMQEYVRAHGLEGAVTFAGPVPYEELPRYFQAADVFLFPSPYEGLPSVVLESMACGTPPIVMRGSGGTEEAVVHGEVGWVTDMPRLAYETIRILREPERLEEMGKRAAERIRAMYSAERTYHQLSEILDGATR